MSERKLKGSGGVELSSLARTGWSKLASSCRQVFLQVSCDGCCDHGPDPQLYLLWKKKVRAALVPVACTC